MPGLICVPCGMQQTDRQRQSEREREKGARTATHTIEAEVRIVSAFNKDFCSLHPLAQQHQLRKPIAMEWRRYGSGGEREEVREEGEREVYMWYSQTACVSLINCIKLHLNVCRTG